VGMPSYSINRIWRRPNLASHTCTFQPVGIQ
jgi:hypothetical protein